VIADVSIPSPGPIRIYAGLPDVALPSRLEQIQAKYPINSLVEARVTTVDDRRGVFLVLGDGSLALAYKSRIGPDGVFKPSHYYRVGETLTVRVEHVKLNQEGEPRIEVAIDADLPVLLTQVLAFVPIKSEIKAIVRKIDDKRGLSLDLSNGLQASASKKDIGTEGVVKPSQYYTVGQELNVLIDSVQIADQDRPRIQVKIQSIEIPSRLEQLQQLYRPGMQLEAIVNGIDRKLGIFVTLESGESALVHKNQIGPNGVADPSPYFSRDQRVQIQIVSVKKLVNGNIGINAAILQLPGH
jgi:ribosomal protein S1